MVVNELSCSYIGEPCVTIFQGLDVYLVDTIDKLLLESGVNMMVQLAEAELILVVAEECLYLGSWDGAGIDGLNEDDSQDSCVYSRRNR
jgi:hypothetical protein